MKVRLGLMALTALWALAGAAPAPPEQRDQQRIHEHPLMSVLLDLQDVVSKVDMSPTSLARHLMLNNGSTAQSEVLGSFKKDWERWETCALGLWDIVRGVINFQIWAIKVLDSGTKLQSGILEGNLIDLGQFDECVETDRSNASPVSWVGQHCLVQLVLSMPSLGNATININGVNVPIVDLLGGTSVKLTGSQCYPSVCSPAMIQEALNYLVVPANYLIKGKNATLSVVVDDRDCHLKDRGPLKVEEWVVIAVCALFVLIALVCSAFDIIMIQRRLAQGGKPTNVETIIRAFSIPFNGKKLLGVKANSDQMGAINGMKFLSIAWVVLGHRYRYSVQQPMVNLLSVPDILKQWTKMFLLNATLSVDTFFLISGMLNAYSVLGIMDKKKGYSVLDVIISYIYRYIRLSPAYWLMIAVTGTWLYRVGDGPIWDRLVGDARDNCQKTWWSNIIYLNNYLNPDENCMMQSWYLAADMQMYWLSPFVIYPLWRWPIFGLIELLLCTLASVAAPFAVSYIYDIREPIPISNDAAKVSREMDMLYLPTHTKTVAYVVGIGLGYLVYKLRTKKIRLRWSLIIGAVGWIISGVFMLYALFGCYWLFQMNNPYTLLEDALYLGFYRLIWALGVSWVILVCVTGHGGFVDTMLAWKPFGPLGRFTYCIYLTHIAVIIYRMGSIRTAGYLEDYGQIEQFLGDLVMSIWGATILTLIMESPFLTFLNMIFRRKRPAKPRGKEIKPEPPVTMPEPPLNKPEPRLMKGEPIETKDEEEPKLEVTTIIATVSGPSTSLDSPDEGPRRRDTIHK